MLGRVLFQNNDCIVAAGLLGGMKVIDLHRKVTLKLSLAERRYVGAVIDAAAALGVPISPTTEVLSGFFEQLAEAVLSRGGALWRVFFTNQSSDEFGRMIAEAYCESVR